MTDKKASKLEFLGSYFIGCLIFGLGIFLFLIFLPIIIIAVLLGIIPFTFLLWWNKKHESRTN